MVERYLEVRQESLDMIYDIIRRAIEERATDVHWEPFVEGGREEIIVRFRIDGLLKDVQRLEADKEKLNSFVNAIKIMAMMDTTKKRTHQDGRFTFMSGTVEYDIRVATMPTILGEKIVMRMMDRNRYCMNFSDLGMSQEVVQILEGMVQKPEGFVIISGPTGSGKTTTLYSILQHIYAREKNICTIEDPVEVKFPGISQIQVLHEFGMTFVTGLRAIMRQDANVIAVGEMRDAETARTALQAALTGTLVFSTLHARDAVNSIVRLLDMGVEPFFIATALSGIISQRLLRLVCKICKGRGCVQCSNTGFKKRTGIFEILKINDVMRQLILRRAPGDELKAVAMEQNMVSFSASLEPMLSGGLTTKEEIDRILALE
jgi:type II secretory ATPase GspE/PulE/Tfp pilus assembly ATPase PilB-like protein